MHAARLAAPLVHPKPQPEPRHVTFELPEEFGDAESLKNAHATLLRSIASGETSLEEAKELSVLPGWKGNKRNEGLTYDATGTPGKDIVRH